MKDFRRLCLSGLCFAIMIAAMLVLFVPLGYEMVVISQFGALDYINIANLDYLVPVKWKVTPFAYLFYFILMITSFACGCLLLRRR